MKTEWVDGYEIRVVVEKDEIVISANRMRIILLKKARRK